MTVLNAYRKVVIKNVKRMDSRGSNSYPDGPYNSAEAWREAVRNEIASLYNVFYLYNFINKAPHKKVSVSQRLLNTLGMVYHRFPIQSTLFALSFYEKQIENVANKRDELLSWKPASIFSMSCTCARESHSSMSSAVVFSSSTISSLSITSRKISVNFSNISFLSILFNTYITFSIFVIINI